MKDAKTRRDRIVGLRLTGKEFAGLESEWKKSTILKLSEYIRRILLGKPFTVYTRNKSMDDLMAEMVLLRKELNAIGNNFNQAVHRLHTLDHLPQMALWLKEFERDRQVLFDKVGEIKWRIDIMTREWLQ